jgi:hypothetical protein
MIPGAMLLEWHHVHPWPDMVQVEQDLILSRALVEIFQNPILAEHLAFRGGTALHKLFLPEPLRYRPVCCVFTSGRMRILPLRFKPCSRTGLMRSRAV